jgi:small-conductance mechanosensitive channel
MPSSSFSSFTDANFWATISLFLLFGKTIDCMIRAGTFFELFCSLLGASLAIVLIRYFAGNIGFTLSSLLSEHPFKHDSTLSAKFQDTVSQVSPFSFLSSLTRLFWAVLSLSLALSRSLLSFGNLLFIV